MFQKKRAHFVDLFVRVSNQVTINMYRLLGYTLVVYRAVLEHYSGDPDEDGFDTRKALPRDIKKRNQ
jgi:N-terminal acetyltransferase B complex catalytic subunit